MNFLPKALRRKSKLVALDWNSYDPHVLARFLLKKPGWSFYAITFDGSNVFYGFVEANRPDAGYANLNELQSTLDKLGCEAVRDWRFQPCRLTELRNCYKIQKRS